MQPAQVTQLQSHILRGEWGEALQLLAMLVSSGELLREAKFLVRACTPLSVVGDGGMMDGERPSSWYAHAHVGVGVHVHGGEQIRRRCTA